MLNKLTLVKDKVMTDDMTRHGTMMVFFVLLGTIFNFLFTLAMMRMLSPVDYGTFLALISLLMIVGVFTGPIDTSVAKFVSKEWVHRRLGRISYLWRFFFMRAFVAGVVLFLLLTALSPLLSGFFNIENSWYLVIVFSALIFSFGLFVNWGTMRGLQRFLPLGATGTLWAFLKFAFAIILVYLGLGLSGSLIAFSLAYAGAFLVTLLLLRDILHAGNEKVEASGISSYFGLALLAIVAFTVSINIDMILAKHFLNSGDAGVFAATSLLGKMSLSIPGGILIAMFPKTSELFETGKAHVTVMRKALLLTVLFGGVIVIIYCFFPGFIANVLNFFHFQAGYLGTIPYLFKYALAMLFFAVAFLLLHYFLSINRTKVAYFFVGAMGLEICLIILFHSSIAQIVNIMLISGASCLVLILPFYLKVRNDLSGGASLQ